MANRITKAERGGLIEMATAMLPNHDPTPGEFTDLVKALREQAGISHDRARNYVAKAIRLRRGEQVRRRNWTRLGIGLDDDSLEHIRQIEQATRIEGASAVIREALRRWAADL